MTIIKSFHFFGRLSKENLSKMLATFSPLASLKCMEDN